MKDLFYVVCDALLYFLSFLGAGLGFVLIVKICIMFAKFLGL